jgi:hypothetical protein
MTKLTYNPEKCGFWLVNRCYPALPLVLPPILPHPTRNPFPRTSYYPPVEDMQLDSVGGVQILLQMDIVLIV